MPKPAMASPSTVRAAGARRSDGPRRHRVRSAVGLLLLLVVIGVLLAGLVGGVLAGLSLAVRAGLDA